ncbi:hypothetical protein HK405_011621 [Cladochytrium tenue]|nr:hypothetical protein HK405_011621 [Cladochytrium tenue]
MPPTGAHQQLIQQEFLKQAESFASIPNIADPTRAARLKDAVAPSSTDTILEIAAGPGYVAIGFAPHVKEVVGVDVTEKMLEIANRNKDARGIINVSFMRVDIESESGLPFSPNTFDAAVCRLAFHHFKDPTRVLARMAAAVKPNGLVAIEDMVGSGISSRRDYQDRWETMRDPSHTKVMTLAEFADAFASCGLDVETVKTDRIEQNVARWFRTTETSPEVQKEVVALLEADMQVDFDRRLKLWRNY